MASAGGGVFSQTLQTITTTKLEELSNKRATFEDRYRKLISSVKNENDPLSRLRILIEGVQSCFGATLNNYGSYVFESGSNPRLGTELKLIRRFAEQAEFDPSISAEKIREWETTLYRYLEVQSVRYQFATLYGQLVTEWLASEQALKTENVEMTDAFEEVPQGKKLEARAMWERAVFEPFDVNEAELHIYLHTLFGQNKPDDTDDLKKAFEEIRKSVGNFDNNVFGARPFDVHCLRWVIGGLVQSDLLDNEKRAVLKDFLGNPIILSEVADVLNMRMAALDAWSWGSEVIVEERKKITGFYNIHLREDLLQAIFLQFIGVKWSVFLKTTLKGFRRTKGVWKLNQKKIPKEDKRRREYYLGPQSMNGSVQRRRMRIYKNKYLLTHLPDTENQQIEIAEGEDEAEFEMEDLEDMDDMDDSFMVQTKRLKRSKQTARKSTAAQAPRRQLASKAARKSASNWMWDGDGGDSDDDVGKPKNPMELKQDLLHLVSTEIEINKSLHGEQTVFKSVFQDWNPLLPHKTILKVLEFFGVSPKWLAFFRKFLEAPLKFSDDIMDARTRKRGTPGSHALSDFFGELILFNLDFSVNQETDGGILWRMHDEFWFWSPKQDVCITAWNAVTKFARAMGVSLNGAKTGSVRINGDPGKALKIAPSLPSGDIRWGFLYLDGTTGRFEIDQNMINHHIIQLQKQLRDKQSIFGWIQAFNTYATTFFTTNFGKPAVCFGKEHIDKILATHERIHRVIFEEGGAVQYLKGQLKDRFGVENVPDGFLYFPIELGGLNLKNPFVDLLQIRNSGSPLPADLIEKFLAQERTTYRNAKEAFDVGKVSDERYALDEPDWKPKANPDVFMSFEEYTKYRFEYNPGGDGYGSGGANLGDVFTDLLKRPDPQPIDPTPDIESGLMKSLDPSRGMGGLAQYFVHMEPYWKWIAQQYGREMIEKFGGFTVVEAGLLPTGMVSLFRDKRVSWEG